MSSVCQRRIARNLGIHPSTVARKVEKLARFARAQNSRFIDAKGPIDVAIFDEMETFEHSKCKPMSLAIAVDEATRQVLGIEVSTMPAKGRLAAVSRKKYGHRPDNRRNGLRKLMEDLRRADPHIRKIKSDMAPRYPSFVKRYFPTAIHEVTKGRRGCVVGQGELKEGGWDPIFNLNHTCAMVRDNVKRLSRRTWCTTKTFSMLQDLLDLYMCWHNQYVENIRLISICPDPII